MNKLLTFILFLASCSSLNIAPSNSMSLIVPFYDLSYKNQIYKAANEKVRLTLIFNPHDGPGLKVDKEWQKVINDLRKENVQQYGYIDLVNWSGNKPTKKEESQIKKEIDNWKAWYKVNLFFFDDWSEKIKAPAGSKGIANPGFPLKTDMSYTVIWESEKYTESKDSKQSNSIVIAMKQSDFKPALELAKKRDIKMFYSVEKPDDWNAYNGLPSYFEEMCSYFK